jgi:hypothetical protein
MAIEALVGSGSPVLRPGFLCTLDYEPAKPVHKKHNARRFEHPSSGVPGSIGVGRSGLSLLTWNGHSPKFALKEFSEVGQEFIGNSSPLASVAVSADLGGADHPALRERGRL